jgi:hypothetical protein
MIADIHILAPRPSPLHARAVGLATLTIAAWLLGSAGQAGEIHEQLIPD